VFGFEHGRGPRVATPAILAERQQLPAAGTAARAGSRARFLEVLPDMLSRACLIFVLAGAGCLGPEYDDLRIAGPSVIHAEPGALLELRAYGERAGSTSVDLTRSLTWMTTDWEVANVTDDGTVLVTDAGFTHICAILDDELRATVAISSEAQRRSMPNIDVSVVTE
jgi:hypothetical protein